ncbi:hypothetical protein [Curtobacterium sp. MCSS17_016]|uniref:hypothetical protein n=1 Tax=Curtobacterium sp. MCSS17_016 TaxID=2175644 RepID=UPI000DA6E01F|nr:hypothetical protein [Curtobacterium sp. MCSS17_016]WIE81228.1 hypothetical protein DEJ19_018515 [Curtobacterium sp. MCSS17_016]
MTTFNEHDHPRATGGRFTEKQQEVDTIALASAQPPAHETATHLTIDVAERLEDIRDMLDSGETAKLTVAYDAMKRATDAMTKARSELARAVIGDTIRTEYPTAATLELGNWGSSSEPHFVPTAVRTDDGTVLWNSDDRKPGERAQPWEFRITEPMLDLDENTITVPADGFRDHPRNAIRLR